MDDLLLPDTPPRLSSNDATEEIQEPTCCSPTRSKLKTSPIKLFSVIHIVCGVLSIGLGIAALTNKCTYSKLCFPIVGGCVLVITGSIGMFVRKHGVLTTVLRCFCFVSFLCCFIVVLVMIIVLPENEGSWEDVCMNHDCIDGVDNCCYANKLVLRWKNVSIYLAILVVSVVGMVASLLASTLCLHNVNWINVCNLKEMVNEPQLASLSNSLQITTTSSGEISAQTNQSAAVKTCWTPCSSNRYPYRNTIIFFSVAHVILGIASVALGISSVLVECIYAHVGVPIWSGILIFCTTGIYGLLSVKMKGSYVPCFLSLSILSLVFSVIMFFFGAAQRGGWASVCYYSCTDWSCYSNTSSYNLCDMCLPGCCDMDYNCDDDDYTKQDSVIVRVILVGAIEMGISIVTFGLAFSQLTCYKWCWCCCCCQSPNDQYIVGMASDGNLMMAPPPQPHNNVTQLQNQPMMVQPAVIQGSSVTSQQQHQREGTQPSVMVQAHGQPMHVQGSGQRMVVGGQGQPMVIQQPDVFAQGMGQLDTVQGQGQPAHTMVQAQMPNPGTQTQLTGELVGGEARALVAGQEAGNISNPIV